MAENSKIEWTDHTFNPWTGCTKVSPGCDHCYAESWAKRSGAVRWGVGEPRRRTTAANWRTPLKWQAQPWPMTPDGSDHRRPRVFCASLADVFDNDVPPQWRGELWALIRETPHLDWLMLTKRIGNASGMLPADWFDGYPNVWIGATVVNQEEADRDIPKLLAVPARVRFLSIEPMLGPVDLHDDLIRQVNGFTPRIDWVIAGGESGHGARPMHPDWARSLRDQCAAAGVAFLFKQWGAWAPGAVFPDTIPSGEYCDFDGTLKTDDERVWHVPKKIAGRLLDGVTHDGFPQSA